jgi:hypothetical protein
MVFHASGQRSRRLLLLGAIITLLPTWLLSSGLAYAANSGCRTDPLIILTNGAIIDMSATIGTSLLHVQQVDYTLHAPQGTALLLVVRTPDWPTTIENFSFVADAAPGEYNTNTVIYTTDTDVAVTASTSVGLRSRSASGWDRQDLQVHISR